MGYTVVNVLFEQIRIKYLPHRNNKSKAGSNFDYGSYFVKLHHSYLSP